jgi:hypothetical protein
MAGVIDHPLIELADQIVARTRPVEERPSIRRILYDIVLYIKRAEKSELTPEEEEYLAHQKSGFPTMAASKELADGFRDRIRIIDEYQIESAFRIHEMLEYGFEITSTRTLTADQVSTLQELVKDPMMNISRLSTKLHRSRHNITKVINQLEEHFALSRLYVANRGKLKFTLFNLFFRTKSFNHSKALESWIRQAQPLFLTSIVFDVTFQNGFLAYAIPSQNRAHRLFEKRVRHLEQTYFEWSHLQRATEHFWNIRFDHYDPHSGQWLVPSVLENLPDNSFSTQTRERSIPFCTHADLRDPVKFDIIDLLITKAKMKAGDTIADLQAYLTQYDHKLSYNALSQRLNRLKHEEIIFSHLYFSGAGIEEFVGLSIYCKPKTQRELQILASFFPLSFTYLTQQGIVIFVKRPTGWRDFFKKFIQDLPAVFDIDEFMVVYQERNYGSGLREAVYNRWNEKRQYWTFTNEEI